MAQASTGRVVLAATLALLFSGACDNADRMQTPDINRNADIILTTTDPHGNVKKLVTYKTPPMTETAVELIGKQGGTVSVQGHSLIVPKDAVHEDTWFLMTALGGDTIHVQLTALKARDLKETKRFHKTVTLNLSYANAEVDDAAELIVTWLPNGSTKSARVPVPGMVVQSAQIVSAQLKHFSDYALGEN